MNNTSINIFGSDNKLPWFSLLILVVFFIVGLFIGQFFGVVVSLVFTGSDLQDLLGIITLPFTGDKRIPLLLVQGFGAFGGFIAGTWAYMIIVERKPLKLLFSTSLDIRQILLAILIVLSFMMVNSLFIEWNADITFPSFLKGFESWAKAKEQELKMVTDFLTSFDTNTQFIIALIVIGIIPAFGEELLFRGVIQNKLGVYLKNPHVAIWITAILFSGFHMQFYGFVPRLFLGLLFGYLYYWSCNLWVPVFAHFINNAFTLVLIFMYQRGMTEIDIENQASFAWQYLILFGGITGILIYYFRRISMIVITDYD